MSIPQLFTIVSGYLLVLLFGTTIALPYWAGASSGMRGLPSPSFRLVRLSFWMGGGIAALLVGHGLISTLADRGSLGVAPNMPAAGPFSVIFPIFAAVIGGIRGYFRWTTRHSRPAVRNASWHDRVLLLCAFMCMVPLTSLYLLTPALDFADFAAPRGPRLGRRRAVRCLHRAPVLARSCRPRLQLVDERFRYARATNW